MTAVLNEALEILHDSGPEFGGGLSNHGPMGAEALVRLNRPDSVVPWTADYRTRLDEHPQSRSPIAADDWWQALGRIERAGDWIVFFDRELAEAPWRQVLDRWVGRLAPGLASAATHGVIRTAHAVRAVAEDPNPLRLHELAEGLGYWAARYQKLPLAAGPRAGLPSSALGAVPRLGRPAGFGFITARLEEMAADPSVAARTPAADLTADLNAFLDDLTRTFAAVYLANVGAGSPYAIAFVHAVTGPRSLRLIAPHVSPGAARAAAAAAWTTAAAIHSGYSDTAKVPALEDPPDDTDEIIDRAVATGDEHAIKFTEACLAEHARNPHPIFLAAAWDVAGRLRA